MNKIFQRLGLNNKEMDTFLKMLELGAQPISVIARHAGVPRSTMYLIIDNLKKTQLVETFERIGIKYAKAIPVKDIGGVLRARERQIEQTVKMLEEAMPELEALENKLSITPHVRFHEGKQAVLKMYESMLGEKTFVAIFNPQLVKRYTPEYHFKIPETIHAEKMEVRELLVLGSDAIEYEKKFQSKKHQIRLLPQGVAFPSDTIICPDKIYMVGYGENDMVATEIHNRALAETQKVIFDQLWKTRV